MATPTTNKAHHTSFNPALLGAGRYVASGDKWGDALGTSVVLEYSFPTGTGYHDPSYSDDVLGQQTAFEQCSCKPSFSFSQPGIPLIGSKFGKARRWRKAQKYHIAMQEACESGRALRHGNVGSGIGAEPRSGSEVRHHKVRRLRTSVRGQ